MALNKPSETLQKRMSQIENKVLVLSGKGGVGKSTVTTQLAQGLVRLGKKVGVLDIDICGPSIPKIFGVEDKEVHQCDEGWVPVYIDDTQKLSVMSIGFLLNSPDDAVVWRGPKKNTMIKQFMEDVIWGSLDYLLIDTPPGTSDEHISIAEMLKADGAVLVTTPQGVALSDVKKEISFCKKFNIPILGIVENMSGYVCPCCGEVTEIFSRGGGDILCQQYQVELLGRIPIEPQLGSCEDEGKEYIKQYSQSPTTTAILEIVDKLQSELLKQKEAQNQQHQLLTNDNNFPENK